MKSNLIPVPFRGTTLYVIPHEDQPFTPMKPIVEGMGLAWAAQTVKLNTNKARWGVSIIETPIDPQPMLCLPLRKLPGWLMSIHPNKVKPEVKDSIIAYQNECDDLLWHYWSQGKAVHPRQDDDATLAAQPRLHFCLNRAMRTMDLSRDAFVKRMAYTEIQQICGHLNLTVPPAHLIGKPADQMQLI